MKRILVTICASIKHHLIMLCYLMYCAITGHLRYLCCSLQILLAPGCIHSACQQIHWFAGTQRSIHEFIHAKDDMLLLDISVWFSDISHTLYRSHSFCLKSLTYSLSVQCPHQTYVHISRFLHTCYTPDRLFFCYLITQILNVHFIASLSKVAVTACAVFCTMKPPCLGRQ
jgi:hypothetical protein